MQLLGKGSFGSVYCVRRLNDRSLHVMKKISIHNMPQKERIATEQECKVLQRLRHPGIVCYEDSFIHKNRQLCIVMAFCEGGDLAGLIQQQRSAGACLASWLPIQDTCSCALFATGAGY